MKLCLTRDERIEDAKEGITERPYPIAFNIGYDDYPNYDNPFNESTHKVTFDAYGDGFSTAKLHEEDPPVWTFDDSGNCIDCGYFGNDWSELNEME